mmetsp:Transcript_71505/g.207025  ORF Transcript_71505/g.207025 Transcript_71505/m.207025 type:complete len:221 (+) Transcript_71505:659-1321(+)
MPRSSAVSMSPPLSLSCLSKSCLSSATRSSLNPAFFFSFATISPRHASTTLTKASKSNASGVVLTTSFGNESYERSFKARLIVFLSNLPLVLFLYLSKTVRKADSSRSRCSRMRRIYSRKSSLPLLFSSTCATKMRISSSVSVCPSSRKRSASSKAEISPDFSVSKRSKTFRISATTAFRKPSRWLKMSMKSKYSLKSKSLLSPLCNSWKISAMFCASGV